MCTELTITLEDATEPLTRHMAFNARLWRDSQNYRDGVYSWASAAIRDLAAGDEDLSLDSELQEFSSREQE